VLPLQEPVRVELALTGSDKSDSPVYTTYIKARISTTLLKTAGDFRLRNVEYLVFEERMPEVLMSKPVLISMGFNLDHHLASVRSTVHDADFSHIGFNTNNAIPVTDQTASLLARILLAPVRDTTASAPMDELPVMSEHALASRCHEDHKNEEYNRTSSLVNRDSFYQDDEGSDNDLLAGNEVAAETMVHLETMIENAKTNGLPEDLHSKFRELVLNHTDIFRTTLGADPPASVPPMVIRLEDDAKPVRVKIRRYSPPQAAFL
jgi:hypothetical protein